MIINKKILLAVPIIFFFIISPAWGQNSDESRAEWEIVNHDDRTIKEVVKIPGGVDIDPAGWEKETAHGLIILTRTVDSWQSYNKLTDRVPVQIEVKNYFFWQKTVIFAAGQTDQQNVYYRLIDEPGINLVISTPPFITMSSGSKINEASAVWDNEQLANMPEGQVMLKTITLQGFYLGAGGFLLGLIIIGIVFMRRIKKVERMMDAEYSLENITAAGDKTTEDEEEENDKWL